MCVALRHSVGWLSAIRAANCWLVSPLSLAAALDANASSSTRCLGEPPRILQKSPHNRGGSLSGTHRVPQLLEDSLKKSIQVGSTTRNPILLHFIDGSYPRATTQPAHLTRLADQREKTSTTIRPKYYNSTVKCTANLRGLQPLNPFQNFFRREDENSVAHVGEAYSLHDCIKLQQIGMHGHFSQRSNSRQQARTFRSHHDVFVRRISIFTFKCRKILNQKAGDVIDPTA